MKKQESSSQRFDEEGNDALVGNFIRIRKEHKLNQANMARAIGIAPQHLSLIETRKVPMSSNIIFSSARALRINPEEFWLGIKLTAKGKPIKSVRK